MTTRLEKDILGEKELPANALYGIHSLRATENFPGSSRFPLEWYRAVGTVKLACFQTYRKFRDAAASSGKQMKHLRQIDDKILDQLIESASAVAGGEYFEHFIVPAVQGGAGTSINMNVNEIIANAALLGSGRRCGEYDIIDPIEHVNIYQSTNDVIPTALAVAVMKLLDALEENINLLRQKAELLEREYRDKLRPGYTQMQEAVPSSFGMLFSTYNEALSRDWWRVSKCSERIRQVNLGGGAIGTGLALPKYFIMEVVPELRNLTRLPLAHSENLADATANQDRWVEVHAILKAHAVNLEKTCSDLRLLASEVTGARSVILPSKQAGSSIMPGKINPVIPEFVISSVHKVYANDILVSSLSALGSLELNAYLPAIGCAVIESIKLLSACDQSLRCNVLEDIIINEDSALKALLHSSAVTTALSPHIGYHRAAELAILMKEKQIDIFEANRIAGAMEESRLTEILKPGNLLKLGFSLDDIA